MVDQITILPSWGCLDSFNINEDQRHLYCVTGCIALKIQYGNIIPQHHTVFKETYVIILKHIYSIQTATTSERSFQIKVKTGFCASFFGMRKMSILDGKWKVMGKDLFFTFCQHVIDFVKSHMHTQTKDLISKRKTKTWLMCFFLGVPWRMKDMFFCCFWDLLLFVCHFGALWLGCNHCGTAKWESVIVCACVCASGSVGTGDSLRAERIIKRKWRAEGGSKEGKKKGQEVD